MPARMMYRKTITMRNSHYQQQSHRGSTPFPETQQGLERNPSHQAPAEPSGVCGTDPTLDDLPCASHPPCR